MDRIREELRVVANEFKTAYESGDRKSLKMLYYFIPLIVAFGLMAQHTFERF